MNDFNLLQEHWRPNLKILNKGSGYHITHHGDGETIWQKYHIVDGNLEGDYEEYHRSIGPKGMFPSILMVTGSFKNDKRVGKWIYYHDNGKKWIEEIYENDKLNGKSIRYRGDSVLEYDGEYKNGKREGKWTYYHDNGNRNCEGNYENNKPVGKWKFFHYENENIYYITNYKEGLEFGERIEYNLEGQLKRKFIVNNSIKDGYYIEYDKNDSSKILQEGEYKNNKLDGEWKVYKSEQIVISKMYVDDKLDGNWLEFYSDGKKKLISKYKNNKLHGEYIKFNEFEKISEKLLYKNGKLTGDFLSYHKNGVNWKKCKYVFGELDGEYFEFDEYGDVQCEGKYELGKRVGEWNWYGKFSDISPSTKLKIENFNKDGKLHGESISYYQDESVVEQGNYKNGKKDGEWIFRGENGAYQIFNYKNDKKIGEWKSYDEEGRLIYEGVIDKTTIGYHLNGSIYEVIEYNNAVISSRRRYTPDSEVMVLEEKYKNGNKAKVMEWYDTGELKFQCEYKGESKNGTEISWYKNSNKWKLIEYKNNKKHGKIEEFFSNGNFKLRSTYVDGLLSGQYREWFKNNQIRSKGKMVDGKMTGKWTFLYHNGQKESEIICDVGNIKEGNVWLDSGVLKGADKTK